MVKEVVLLPKDKCPLAFIRELGENIKKSWIFLHADIVPYLMLTANDSIMNGYKPILIHWDAIGELSEISIAVKYDKDNIWNEMVGIKTDKINLDKRCTDPQYIYFIKMEEYSV